MFDFESSMRGSQGADYQTSGYKCRVSDIGNRKPGFGCQMMGLKHWLLDAGIRFLVVGFQVSDVGFSSVDIGSRRRFSKV